ncbi:MAG: class I SAM-dependent methyltransferase [bacterium]|nr:class I SAM-dependent methyltransferase [bacterium]
MYSIILLIILAILFFVVVFLALQLFNIIFLGFAPFISAQPQIINKILAEIDLQPGDKVYELGCGYAGFLRAICDKFPKVEAIGIENDFWPYFLARIQIAISGKNIKIIRKNLFKVNLSDADLIYCYLNVDMMEKLKEKFNKECKSGAVIVSYRFPLHGLNTTKVIQSEKGSIYFYKVV